MTVQVDDVDEAYERAAPHGHRGPLVTRGLLRLWRAVWLPATVAAAPLLWLLARELSSLGHDTAVCCDWAVLQLQAERAGRFEVLTGAYSRYGWHHPGPAAAYLAAPFHRLAGSDFVGLTVATAAVNASWVFVLVLVLRVGRGGAAGWTASVVTLAFLWGVGINRMSDPWNPLLVILPTAVVAVSLAGAVDGMRWALPVAAFAGSFAVQAHVGAAPAVGAMGLCGAVLIAVSAGPARRALLPALLVSAGVLALVWLPPAIEQFTEEPGNMGRIASFARAGHEGQSWEDAVDVVGVQVTLGVRDLGGYLIGGKVLPLLSTPRRVLLGVQVLLLAGTVVLAARRRLRMELGLGLVSAAGAVGALVGATRVTGLLEPYLTAAAIGVGLAVWLAVALGAVAWCRRWMRDSRRCLQSGPTIRVVRAGLVTCSVAFAIAAVRPQLGTEAWSRQMSNDRLEGLDAVIERELRPDDHIVYVDFAEEQWEPAAATMAELESAGRTAIGPASYDFMFGDRDHRASPDVCIRYTGDRREVDTRPDAALLWMGDVVGKGHLSTVLLIRGSACLDLWAGARAGG